MSFFNNISNAFGSVYDGLKAGLKTIWNPVKSVANWVQQGAKGFDRLLQNNHIPFLQPIVNTIKSNPLYHEVLKGVDSITGFVNDLDQAGGKIDDIIQNGILKRNAGNSAPIMRVQPVSVGAV